MNNLEMDFKVNFVDHVFGNGDRSCGCIMAWQIESSSRAIAILQIFISLLTCPKNDLVSRQCHA